ncbi:MAG: hypothetical protein EOM91_14235 [Sphingobacteriia bacterium]|nr:hypothetical protein [Sphingobacteriia bacterium]
MRLDDLIVVLPGIMGSTLAKDGRVVWAPSAGAVLRAIATFGRNLEALTLPDGIGDDHPEDGVEALGLMPDLHILPGIWSAQIGYSGLLDWLQSRFHLIQAPLDNPDRFANFVPFSYDWRLSNRYNARRLKAVVEPALEKWRSQDPSLREAKVTFICHSMGGLVARWYIEREGGAEITRKLITLGTPHRGALIALETLVNGAAVGLGPLAPRITRLARSLPSLYQLLPEYACIETADGLAKTTETALPELTTAMVADAMRFHTDLDAQQSDSYDFHPIVGFRQPTKTTAELHRGWVRAFETIEGNDEGGDGTVPRLAATPARWRPDNPAIRSAAERHGSLQSNRGVLDELEFVLGARAEPYKAAGMTALSVRIDDIALASQPIPVKAATADGSRFALLALVRDEVGREVARLSLTPGEPHTLSPLPPGGYSIDISGVGTAAHRIAPVKCPLLVWDAEAMR